MNIGTMGAAVILSGNATRMGRGYGGGGRSGGEEDPKPEGFFKQWGLLIFNILTFLTMLIVFILDVSKSDLFYTDIKAQVVEKKVVSEKGTKGQVYDEGYLRLRYETPASPMFGDVNPAYEWVNTCMTKYLNTEVGDTWIERVEREDSSLSFWRWTMGFCILAWSVGAGFSMAKQFP